MDNTPPSAVDINLQPGHMIRRLQQIAVGIFHQETQDLDVTPVQYAVLQLVHNQPRADQRTIARSIALDTSTTAAVIDRLEARALLQRHASPDDRRLRLLTLTPSGEELLSQTIPRMEDAQKRIASVVLHSVWNLSGVGPNDLLQDVAGALGPDERLGIWCCDGRRIH
jgi:DNA-binding MarR family transcriptional regulator